MIKKVDKAIAVHLPQVAEANPPQSMDVAGEGLLYDESKIRIKHVYMASSLIPTIQGAEQSQLRSTTEEVCASRTDKLRR